MKTQFKNKLKLSTTLLAVGLVFILATGCSSSESNSHATAVTDSSSSKSADEIVPPKNPDGFSGAIGNVVKYSDSEVTINANDKPVVIKLTDSLKRYAPSPSSLTNVKSSAYIGVISKKGDQGEQAAQVLILPEELRGLNEGSFMLPADKDAESAGQIGRASCRERVLNLV